MSNLDEKGFVFIGNDNKPYWCRMWGEAPWFFWWHPDNLWVSLRQVNQTEIWAANKKAIPDDKAEVYHLLAKAEQ